MFETIDSTVKNRKPRPYQVSACDEAIELHRKAVNGVVITGPPGVGKSLTMAILAERLRSEGGVLILAEREELVYQNARTVGGVTGEECYIEMADSPCKSFAPGRMTSYDWDEVARGGIVSGSSCTMQGRRLSRIPRDAIRNIIVDECDLIKPGGKYDRIRGHFNDRVWYGATATPRRKGRGKSNGLVPRIFDRVVNMGSLFDFQEAGWLVDIKIRHLQEVSKLIDFTPLRNLENNIITEDAAKKIWAQNQLESTVAIREALFKYSEVPTIVFCSGVAHASMVADACNAKVAGIADYVASYLIGEDGSQLEYPSARRDRVPALMEAGNLRYVMNQNVFSRGTDMPCIGCVAFARPVQSVNFYQQAAGRSGRVLDGVLDGLNEASPAERKAAIAASGKPYAVLLDMIGVTGELDICSPVDLITDPDWTPEKRKIAQNYIREQSAQDNSPSLSEVKHETEARVSAWAEAIRMMLKHVTATVEWDLTEYNPREDGINKQYTKPLDTNTVTPPTQRQVDFYMKLQAITIAKEKRYTETDVFSKGARWCGFWIGKLKGIADAMPTHSWQRRKLHLAGKSVPATRGAAQALLNSLKKEGEQQHATEQHYSDEPADLF